MLKLYVYTQALQNSGFTQLWIFHNCEGLDEYCISTIMVWMLIPVFMR